MVRRHSQASTITGYGQGKTILVVDDEAVIRDLLKRTLLREGFEVVTASDGEEGLKRLAAGKIDVLITDIVMPNMDGRELLQQVNKDYPHIPVIFITGQASKAERKHSGKSDSEIYIVKPFKNQDIRFALQLIMLKLQKRQHND